MLSAILKLMLFVQILDLTVGSPLGVEDSSDVSVKIFFILQKWINFGINEIIQENIVWVPLPMSYLTRVSASLHNGHRSYPKRNSELITSLLGIDKNIEMAGK